MPGRYGKTVLPHTETHTLNGSQIQGNGYGKGASLSNGTVDGKISFHVRTSDHQISLFFLVTTNISQRPLKLWHNSGHRHKTHLHHGPLNLSRQKANLMAQTAL